ncbi:MAG: transposase [Proteobacteria bacterium]|nr:transposase [Pseudomonadota bacterium]
MAMSMKLWLPIKTDCVDSDLSSSNGSSRKQTQNSWFSTDHLNAQTAPLNLLKTSCLLQTCLLQETTECDQRKTEKIGGTRKIKLYPTQQQKRKLRMAFGAARWTYNKCLERIKKAECKVNVKELRKLCVNNDNLNDKWLLDTPYDIRDEALRDLYKSYQVNFKSGKPFKKQFRSKKDGFQTIVIHKKHWVHKRGWYGDLTANLKSSEPLPKTLYTDSRLQMTSLNEFFLVIQTPPQYDNQVREDIVALDPGVRTFQTCYSPSGQLTEWGNGDMKNVMRLLMTHDKLQSLCTKVNHRKRYKLHKAMKRIQKAVKCRVDDIHRKCIKWLLENHGLILIPVFGVKKIASSKWLRKGTRRALYAWSHFLFRQRLLDKAKSYKKCRVLVVDESYTSRTCTQCGCVNVKYSSKTLLCARCGLFIDRDINGARNVFLKFLTEQGLTASALWPTT